MNTDVYLVVGIVLGVLALPSMMSAFSEGRAPRIAAIMVMIAGTLIVLALSQKPGGYALGDIPRAFYRVIGQIMN
ncbi:hypothetical protein E7811_09915 [Aliigemmobacter aestuarii]|uniref:50S ribosomal protein L35 n=1 Tax=Aliigemmobacter aestuarii TaxID=1445661 RepID=A0A4S3MMV2_9RHOB|nr:hypothetical protein [Gemmobacter aestuarii]THD83587.1 hypothetical protein E7811_09915 [Gemmobacter aestuarii]